MIYYCVDCQSESEELGELTGREHANPKADYLSGETCECGGRIDSHQ
jgi:DNA-directed RNA polymerase subunit RPC12/RpoP